jgi:C4-dicarboxylate-binding protein DctP
MSHVRRRLLTAALALPLGARAQAPLVIKFSHVVAPETPKGKAAQRFKELAEARTGGRVRIELYPNSQLYKDKEEMEALQLGSVQMLAPSLAKFGPLGVKEFEVFDLPFLFKDTEAFRAITEGPLGAELFRKLEPKGIRGLAYWDNGFQIMSANRPLRQVSDFKGLKMRIQSSKVLDAQMRALGAIPQVMAFSELYQLEAALKEATAYANTIASTENATALQGIRASGRTSLHTPTPAEMNAWKKALMPVHQAMEARVGKATIVAAYKAAGFVAPN